MREQILKLQAGRNKRREVEKEEIKEGREKERKKRGRAGGEREIGKGKKGRILIIHPSGPLKQHNLLAIESIAHRPVGQGILYIWGFCPSCFNGYVLPPGFCYFRDL